MKDLQLLDQVIVVTGAGQGLGKALAAGLHGAGAKIALLARRQQPISDLASSLGDRALALSTDIGDANAVREAFARIAEYFGEVHALINNAAVFPLFEHERGSDDEFSRVYRTNVLGVSFCVREVLPLMRKNDSGIIINVSSESVLDPAPFLTAYTASKAAVETLGRGLKLELAEKGVRVTTLRLGHLAHTDNADNEGWDDDTKQRFYSAYEKFGHAAKFG